MSTTQPRGEQILQKAVDLGPYGPVGRSPWLDVDWREHQRWLVVEGRPLNTIQLGREGTQPIVFVHGLSGCWQNWLEQLPVLAAEHHVVALDLPGFGHSPMPPGEISINGYARILDALLGELGIDAATVVGNSMGGFIGAELAISFPQRVERLVLVSAAGLATYNEARTARAVPGRVAARASGRSRPRRRCPRAWRTSGSRSRCGRWPARRPPAARGARTRTCAGRSARRRAPPRCAASRRRS